MKTVDYSDISMNMVRNQLKRNGENGRGRSLKPNRLMDAGAESMMATLPGGITSNGKMDVTYMRQL